MADHFVYLMAGLDKVKIGHSATPKVRLSGVATGSAEKLSLAHTWRMERPAAIAFEARLHRLFTWCRITGEWFDIDWRIVQQIGDLDVSGDSDLRDGLLSDLMEWRRLRADDLKGSIAAYQRDHRRGLVSNNEWDSVFLD